MLRLHPDKRAKASDLVHHNWLDSVVVQGEVDVIRRAEEMDKSRRDTLTATAPPIPNGTTEKKGNVAVVEVKQGVGGGQPGSTSREKKRLSGLTQSEVDAMKPVGEVEEEEEEEGEQTTRQESHGHRQPPILSAAPVQGKENTRQVASGKGSKRV